MIIMHGLCCFWLTGKSGRVDGNEEMHLIQVDYRAEKSELTKTEVSQATCRSNACGLLLGVCLDPVMPSLSVPSSSHD